MYQLKRKKTSLVMAAVSLSIVATLTVWFHRPHNRNPQSWVVGSWYLDDLRTEQDEGTLVTFTAGGDCDMFPSFGDRWELRDNRMVFRWWPLIDGSRVSRELSNTKAYSWIASTEELSFRVKLNEDGTLLELRSVNDGRTFRLRRSLP